MQTVAVIGAGLGGLVLARTLQLQGRDVAVFERDTSRGARKQGGLLDMHQESGQWALAAAGLEDAFRKLIVPHGEDLKIVDKQGRVLWEEISDPAAMHRPEVERQALRDMLVDALKPGTIRWDSRLVAIAPAAAAHGGHLLRFADGTTFAADVVVGADGANSATRRLLTDAQPAYTGVSFVEIGIGDAARRHPACAALVGGGSLFALDDNMGILAKRGGDGCIRIYAAFRVPLGGLPERGLYLENATPDTAREAIARQFAGWAPELIALIMASDDGHYVRPLDALPVGLSWPSRPGLTLLGDAAHLMSPFAGAGANMAMEDGARLALALIAESDTGAAIAGYEQDMFLRAERDARQSAQGMDICISDNGAERMARLMRSFQPPA
jgi:2-polyprenyl-6-methoxyphenol hydroxylase-like FAD-dependent oxidoreductase